MMAAMRAGYRIADRFEIVAPAGRGGMGTVHRAHDRLRGVEVAVKTVNAPDADIARRFAREVEVLELVQHPAVVRHVAHGVTPDGELFLAMEWLDGEDLAKRTAGDGLSVAEAVQAIGRVAAGLAAAHAAGIVHRDVKPSNVILAGGDPARAKVLDFGLAHLTESRWDRTRLTQRGLLLGTPGYVAPEQIRGETVTARTDVFGLGAVLFECLTGRPAFAGRELMAVLGRILFETAPRVNEQRDEPVDDALDELVADMLSPDPRARPDGMSEVIARLGGLASASGARPQADLGRTSVLGTREQRLVGVVAAGSGVDASAATDATWLPAEASEQREGLLRIAKRFGAEVELLPDGSVIGVVGRAVAPTDLAARTARLALGIAALLPASPIAAVVGRSVVDDRLPVGEAIDRVSSMLRGAPAGVVHIDADTSELLGERFEVDRRDGERLLRRERDATVASRTLLGKVTPFVGRRRELALLEQTFDEVIEERSARAVVVTGEPGMGKTRLLAELLPRLLGRGPVRLLAARGDELRAGSAFAALAPALRAAAGVRDGDALPPSRERIREMVEATMPERERDRVAAFVGELAGVPFADDDDAQLRAARSDPMTMGDQLRAAFVGLLRAESATMPVLVVLEDLHWTDLPTVQLVDDALGALEDAPLLVVGFARPEVERRFPRLFAERGVTRVELGSLSKRAARELVQQILGDDVGDDRIALIVERAGGNAFLLEELIRAVADGRPDHELPDTVLGSIEARLAELDAEARLVLRAASLFGETFWRGGVLAAVGGVGEVDVDGWLRVLRDAELIVRSTTSRFCADVEHTFRHALVRDACYAMLVDRDRAIGHRRAAEWLESAGETDAVLLAEHFERGGEKERAARCYLRATRAAIDGNDLSGAVTLAERGVACGAKGQLLGELRLQEAEARLWNADPERAAELADAAAALLREHGRDWWTATAIVGDACALLGRVDALKAKWSELPREVPRAPDLRETWAVSVARLGVALGAVGESESAARCRDLVERELRADPSVSALVEARLEYLRGVVASGAGDAAAAARHHARSADRFEQAGAFRLSTLERMNAAGMLANVGLSEEALPMLDQALATARTYTLPYNAAFAAYVRGGVLKLLGRTQEAIDVLREAIERQVSVGDVRLIASARYELAEAHVTNGDLLSAEAEARTAVELTRDIPVHCASALAILAHVLLAQGRPREALAAAAEGNAIVADSGAADRDALLRLVRAEALRAEGRAEEAASVIARALDRLRARGHAISDPAVRQAFLSRIPENARTVELARQWGVDADAIRG